MPKILVKQINNDKSTTIVYAGEKREVVLITGVSPWVYQVDVVSKDKMFDKLRELKENEVEKKEK